MAVEMWRLRQDKLMTFDQLRAWGRVVLHACLLCEHANESPTHLFFQCEFRNQVWKGVQQTMDNLLEKEGAANQIDDIIEHLENQVTRK